MWNVIKLFGPPKPMFVANFIYLPDNHFLEWIICSKAPPNAYDKLNSVPDTNIHKKH